MRFEANEKQNYETERIGTMKTKIGRKLLPALLSLLLLIGLMPATVLAAPNDEHVVQIGTTPYNTLNEAFEAAAEMDTYNGEAVSKDNPVVIEVLKDIELDEQIYVTVGWGTPLSWHIKLTSANGENYTITRDPEKVTDYMIQMKRPDSTVEGQYDSSLILENITLDGGATEESNETDSILLAYGWIELNDGAVLRNNKCNDSGGAINLQSSGKLILNDGCLIENNTTTNSGGGIYVWGECVMNGGIIRNNQTLGKYTYGGGVCVDSRASFTMNGGTITQNITYYNGGGLYFDNSGQGNNVFLYGGSITGNQYCSSLTGNTSSDDVYGQFAGTTLVIGGRIEIGDLVFSNAASKIVVDSPLTHAIHIDYSIGMQKDLIVVEKGENYGDGDLDRSKFIFPTSWVDYCFWLTEDASAIKVDNHDGGTNTCTKGAECSNCGKVYGEATGHIMNKTEKVEPTCTVNGKAAYYTCENCHNHFSDEAGQNTIADIETYGIIPATGHSWDEPDWNWSADGQSVEVTFTCKNDGSHVETRKLTEGDIDSTVTASATCTEKGKITYTAKVTFNGQEYDSSIDVDIDPLGHDPQKTEEKEPTATQTGNIEYWYCPQCGLYFKDADLTEVITKEQTVLAPTGETGSESSKPEENTPTVPEKPDSDSPQTGDNNNMMQWIVLLLASMGGVVGTTAYARKRRYNR